MKQYRLAIIQLDTTADKDDNLSRIEKYAGKAAADGVSLVALPEVMNVTSIDPAINAPEPLDGYTVNRMKALARRLAIYIECGSIREKTDGSSKPCNTSILIDPKGELRAVYRKLHPFDVCIEGGPNIRESDMNNKGEEIVSADTELGRLGLTLCYDMRFPELYRILALRGAQVIFVPANFTKPTGEAHWHTLLRARAIENNCYVVAAGQTGEKPRFTAYGHSMVIDPWGRIIAEAGTDEEMITADIDLDMPAKIRAQLGSLSNRRLDIYSINDKHGGPNGEAVER